jgi:hypothetical protein
MPDFYGQYSGAAAGYANQYNIPQPIFFGLIQKESSWNPFAVGDNGAAYGFGQLHAGAASDVGVDRFNPLQNLQGSAAYLSRQYQKYGNWTDALSAYNQGHAGTSKGLAYANSVLDKAKKLFGGGDIDVGSAAACAAGNPLACASAGASLLGLGGSGGCGSLDFVCKLREWVSQSNFFTRLALATLALLLVLGGLYLMKERS